MVKSCNQIKLAHSQWQEQFVRVAVLGDRMFSRPNNAAQAGEKCRFGRMRTVAVKRMRDTVFLPFSEFDSA